MLKRKGKPVDWRKNQKCSFCGRPGHNSLNCWNKPTAAIKRANKPIPFRSKKAEKLQKDFAAAWFRANPPDKDGFWYCYLNISDMCPKRMLYGHVTLEHVYPKASGKYPELKYCLVNIKPACAFCNKLKGGNTPQQLAYLFINVAIMIQRPEWKLWERQLVAYSPRLALHLGY